VLEEGVLDGQVIAFAFVALVLSVTPGPDMALVLRNSLRGGRPAAFRTIFGIGVGLLGWATATALGVAAVLAASATVFTVLKIAGGAYLVYLGIQTLLALRRGEEPLRAKPGGRGSPFRQGLVTNLLNPKLAVFFTTLLPQFISEGDPVFAKSILLAVVFVTIGMTWLVVYAHLVELVARSARFRRTVEAVSGAVLVALGARLAIDRG
jgi:threonine/homoserine/homoserine lactone efflux protein